MWQRDKGSLPELGSVKTPLFFRRGSRAGTLFIVLLIKMWTEQEKNLTSLKGKLERGSSCDVLSTKEGKESYLVVFWEQIHDIEGNPVGIMGVGGDLTEQRRMEAQMIQSAKMYIHLEPWLENGTPALKSYEEHCLQRRTTVAQQQ